MRPSLRPTPGSIATPSPAGSAALDHLSPVLVLLLLTGVFALQPLSTDMYLSSLPRIAREFSIEVWRVQDTLSLFAIGFGLAQLLAGPLADRFGRLPVMLAGIATYLAASVACALAASIEMLVVSRFVQAVGACSGLVCARAMVRDLFAPQEGARMLAKVGAAMAFVPLLCPILGGQLDYAFGWRASFAAMALIAASLLAAAMLRLRETIPARNPDAMKLAPMLANYREILRSRAFLAYALSAAASYGGLFAFISGSSFVFIRVLGLDTRTYSLCYSLAVSGFLAGSLSCRRLLPRLGVQRTLYRAASLSLAGGLGMAALALAGVHHVLALLVPAFAYMMAHGIAQPCVQAGSVAPFPHKAGAASALMGSIMMAFASLVGWWMGASFDGSVYPLVFTMFGASTMLSLVVFVLVRRHGRL